MNKHLDQQLTEEKIHTPCQYVVKVIQNEAKK